MLTSKRGFSNLLTGAILLTLLIIVSSYILLYLNTSVQELEEVEREASQEVAKKRELLRVYREENVVKIVNDGYQKAALKGIFLELNNGDTKFIELPITLDIGDYYVYDLGSISKDVSEIYVLTDNGQIYSPISLKDENFSWHNNELILTNTSIYLYTKEDPGIRYIPNNTLYISTSTRNYEIELKNNSLIYEGRSRIYVSKNGVIILTKKAVYVNVSKVKSLYTILSSPLYIGYDYIAIKLYGVSSIDHRILIYLEVIKHGSSIRAK